MKLLVILLVSAIFTACNDLQSTDKNPQAELRKEVGYDSSIHKLDTPKMSAFHGVKVYEEGEETYLQEIKMDEKVIEALVTNSRVLYVTVRDEGTSQNSYAEYLCGMILEFEANIKKVKIVKAVSSPIKNKAEKDYGVLLGEADCK